MTVYHISPKKNQNSILKKGLIIQKKDSGRIQYGPRIFVSKNKKDLGFDFVNFENVDCWAFDVGENELKKDEFSKSKNHFYVELNVLPVKLTLVKSY